jgi:hypothetical protein
MGDSVRLRLVIPRLSQLLWSFIGIFRSASNAGDERLVAPPSGFRKLTYVFVYALAPPESPLLFRENVVVYNTIGVVDITQLSA